jgi:hypothetical protein
MKEYLQITSYSREYTEIVVVKKAICWEKYDFGNLSANFRRGSYLTT